MGRAVIEDGSDIVLVAASALVLVGVVRLLLPQSEVSLARQLVLLVVVVVHEEVLDALLQFVPATRRILLQLLLVDITVVDQLDELVRLVLSGESTQPAGSVELKYSGMQRSIAEDVDVVVLTKSCLILVPRVSLLVRRTRHGNLAVGYSRERISPLMVAERVAGIGNAMSPLLTIVDDSRHGAAVMQRPLLQRRRHRRGGRSSQTTDHHRRRR
ncbi:hypothetical protein PMAYCL1PPCAC_03234 [Pristionchus mayeri]|uniref:Uncharacterized protein n=1 Tax=Pristionchus mayeri TaxID=1317129 RepID=A0AAN4Z4A7_9BILA|nr:hypothetical protein PMAYCL1PPCAC_03234 [Pristionchus mayeri]